MNRQTFGLKRNVQAMQGQANAREWNTVREWTGPKADASPALRALVANLAAR